MNAAPPPPLPWAQAADTLERFFNQLNVDGPGGAAAAVQTAAAADPAARLAALDHFRQVFTAVPGGDYDPSKDGSPDVWTGVAALVLEASPDERKRFLDEVLFEVAPPSTYDFLADTIRLLVPLDELVRRIVDRLENGSDRQQANALAMQYDLFGRIGDLHLGDARRRKLADAVERLRRTGRAGPEAQAQLNIYDVPQDTAN